MFINVGGLLGSSKVPSERGADRFKVRESAGCVCVHGYALVCFQSHSVVQMQSLRK